MQLGDGFCGTENRQSFLLTLDSLRRSKKVTIASWSNELFDAGVDLYANRPDKEWSLTDCISFVVMERNGLTEALTGDHHFEQGGFVALLK
jgi:predicted nucleic acid-binding protein